VSQSCIISGEGTRVLFLDHKSAKVVISVICILANQNLQRLRALARSAFPPHHAAYDNGRYLRLGKSARS
jgi:hypothetical protein